MYAHAHLSLFSGDRGTPWCDVSEGVCCQSVQSGAHSRRKGKINDTLLTLYQGHMGLYALDCTGYLGQSISLCVCLVFMGKHNYANKQIIIQYSISFILINYMYYYLLSRCTRLAMVVVLARGPQSPASTHRGS